MPMSIDKTRHQGAAAAVDSLSRGNDRAPGSNYLCDKAVLHKNSEASLEVC